jgi:predicted RNase H-like HicB family nuclease
MIFAPLRHVLAPVLALAALTGVAVAQSPACENWRAELASLGQRGGDARAAQAAQRVAGQIARLSNQYRAMGCDRGGFLFFGEAPPPQCGAIRADLGALQAQYGQLQQRAQSGGLEQRKAQLAALIQNNCRPQQRGFFETIFGLEPRRGEIDSTLPELDPEEQPAENQPRQGGPHTVCVRTCDGYFFPLGNSPGGREGQDEMCQALCPGTETLAFGMSNGGDIQNAVARSSGTPYASLPNALKYTRSFDAACTCRGQGQSWAQALQNAEQLLDQRKGDIIVTEERSLEMSRPKPEQPQRGKKAAANAPAAAAAPAPTILQAAPGDEPSAAADVPTASTESAGVGPQQIDGEKTLRQGDGVKRESKSVTGERRTVRIVAPNLAPNLGAAATARP